MRTPEQERYIALVAQATRDFARAEATARELLKVQAESFPQDDIGQGRLLYLAVLLERWKNGCGVAVRQLFQRA
jgi:hypothetical protein